MASQPTATQRPDLLNKTFPVVEVFGPTIQGEGALAGLPTYFVRVGLCDFRCSWCDSMHAVLPEEVKANAEYLTVPQIIGKLASLPAGPEWITLSGGNPAVHELGALVSVLRANGRKVTVETQGSIWRDWLATVDHLTVSPKPPSSGMASPRHEALFARFAFNAEKTMTTERRSLKIVVFDDEDLAWACEMFRSWGKHWQAFLSVGTDRPEPGESIAATRERLGDRTRWLFEQVASRPSLAHVRVLPQLHVTAWGHARAV